MANPTALQPPPASVRPEPGPAAARQRHPGLVWLVAVSAALAGALAPTPWWQLGIIAAAVAVCAAAGRLGAPALRWGLWAATLFVALRVAYRIVFTSSVAPPTGAILLLDLPVIPLGGPFRGIALLGPLTLDQLLATLADASRFAVVFAVFGAANALADARTVLARAPRPMLPVATVLALALGAVPALFSAAQRVVRAARMRGERRGPRLLVPVFEQAVERAGTLGASMELRGFGLPAPTLAAARKLPGTGSLLRAESMGLGYGTREVLSGASLELRAGELTVVTGPTGGGKSSLLAVLAGIAPAYTGGEVTGTVSIPGSNEGGGVPARRLRPARLAGAVALVPQRVEHSFLAETVRAELAFAPARRGPVGAELDAEVDAGLDRFGLRPLAARDPATLSAGEATRVALAAACLARPRVLLLDEPIADLDPESVAMLLTALRGLLADGCAVLVAEHRSAPLAVLAAEVPVTWFGVRTGRLAQEPGPDREPPPGRPAADPIPSHPDPDRDVELARDLVVERDGRTLLRVGAFSVRTGEATVITGPNGSGKTSLLEEIALPEGLSGRAPGVALVPHRVDDLLIRDTVADECSFADRRAGVERGSTARRFEALIAGSIPEQVRAALPASHPRDLSAGTRLALGIALQLAHDPRVLLLDEPTRGLDAAARRRLAELVAALTANGTAVLLATHDASFSALLREAGAATRHRRIVEGELR